MATIDSFDFKSLRTHIACDACETPNPPLRCSRCRIVYYCNRDCQKAHYKEHKVDCRSIETMKAQMEDVGMPTDKDVEPINDTCGICLEENMVNRTVLSECHHAFCLECLRNWQKYQQRGGGQKREHQCPYCRKDLDQSIEDKILETARLLATRGSKEDSDEYTKQAIEQVDRLMDATKVANLKAMLLKSQIVKISDPEQAAALLKAALDECREREAYRLEILAITDDMERADIANDQVEYDRLDAILTKKFKGQNSELNYTFGSVTLIEVKLLLSDAFERSKQYREAIDTYVEILRQDNYYETATPPQTRTLFTGMARCALELQVLDKALDAAEAALSMNRAFPGIHRLLAKIHMAKGNKEMALEVMSRGVLYETPWDDRNIQDNITFYEELQKEDL